MTVIYKNNELDQLLETLKNKDGGGRKIFLLNSCSSETLKNIREITKEVNRHHNYIIELAETYMILNPCSEERFHYDQINLIDDSLEDTIVKYY